MSDLDLDLLDDGLSEEEQALIDALARPDYGQSWYDEPLWSEILPGLWQGGTADHDTHAQLSKAEITTKEFDTVVTLYAFANPVDWFVREIRYGFWDSHNAGFNEEDLFDIVRMAHTDWRRGKKVLVRCQAGWNRSGIISALILIRDGMNPESAIDLLRKSRSAFVLKNPTFEKWLLAQTTSKWAGESYSKVGKKN